MQWVIEPRESITQGSIVSGVNWGHGEDDPPLSIVLSNACDFEHDKLGFLMVAALVPAKETLFSTKEFQSFVEGTEDKGLKKNAWNHFVNYLTSFIHNTRICRYFFFDPTPVIESPLLLVDFQQLRSLDLDSINGLGNEGQLDHPHIEKLMAHFVAYTGRIPSDRSNNEEIATYLEELRCGFHQK